MIQKSRHRVKSLTRNILVAIVLYGFATASSSNLPFHYIGSVLLIIYWLLIAKGFKINNLFIIYSSFTVYAACSGILVCANKETFFIHASLLIQVCLISIIIANIFRSEKDLISFAVMWISLATILTIGPFIGIGEAPSLSFLGKRYVGLTDNPNLLGMYLNYLIMGILYLFSKLKNRKVIKLILFCILILSLFAILTTGSRKSLISAILIIVVYIILQYRISLKTIMYASLAFLIVLFSTDAISVITRDTSVVERLTSDRVETSMLGRASLFEKALEVFMEFPITGSGLANWSYNTNLVFRYSHNYYIEVLANTGIIGFILIMAFYRRFAICVLKLFKNYSTKSEGVYGLLILVFTFVWSFGFSWYDAPHHLIFVSVLSAFYYTYSKKVTG